MATDIEAFVRELRAFDDRRAVMKALRADIRKPFPDLRRAIKARALDTLPGGGGLNAWAASTRITLSTRAASRSVTVTLKGGRNSSGGRSDIRALDRGRVRHPSWGRRGRGQWHTQTVAAGFITKPVTESAAVWHDVSVAAVDKAFDQLRNG